MSIRIISLTPAQVSVMRDHTHGSNRDWKLMHRYCLHNFTCEDGTRGFLGVVSQPGIFSFLELGYIYDRSGQKHPVQVQSTNHHIAKFDACLNLNQGGGLSNLELWGERSGPR